jgi:hypothetical protein
MGVEDSFAKMSLETDSIDFPTSAKPDHALDAEGDLDKELEIAEEFRFLVSSR